MTAASRSSSYADFFHKATGYAPYPYQERLVRDGFPELLVVPTGAGKTAAVIVAWLWRLMLGAPSVPQRFVYVLPLRTLVEQVSNVAAGFVERLAMPNVAVHTLMGGEGASANAWRDSPALPAILVGTQDMLMSRALMRSYGSSRYVAPIDFGMLNNGAQWILDEVQLMGAAVPTSRQLQAMRESFGMAQPTSTTWMSATVDAQRLATVDNPHVGTVTRLSEADRRGSLAGRLDATRLVRRVETNGSSYEGAVAEALVEAHRQRPGKRIIAVLNTVKRATDVYSLVAEELQSADQVVLLHSRFRPPDRRHRMTAALTRDLLPRGRIVVTTQVLEAGVDITSAVLVTEAAPWSSVVQRAGRCNRDGSEPAASLLWLAPPTAAPYEQADIEATVGALTALEGARVTTGALMSRQVPEQQPQHAVLRRRDLVDLFDTTPDLSGNEVDVSRFIRDAQDLDVEVFWRALAAGDRHIDQPPPGADELCRVPVGEFWRHISGANARKAWRYDPLAGVWQRASRDDVRPGRVFLLAAGEGGYDAETGWAPRSRAPVPVLEPSPLDPYTRADDSTEADHGTTGRQWMALVDHLADTERCYESLAAELGPTPGLLDEHLLAGKVAARLHDIGKAHPCFQASLRRAATTQPDGAGPWAKSDSNGRLHHERRYFRHELVGALMLLDPHAAPLLEEVPAHLRDLTRYLVAAHHGKVRLSIRALPGESHPPEPGRRHALGVWEGDTVPAVRLPGGSTRPITLSLECMALGLGEGGAVSWTETVLTLRDDQDLGPFRLAFLEAVVRLADWRASSGVEEAR